MCVCDAKIARVPWPNTGSILVWDLLYAHWPGFVQIPVPGSLRTGQAWTYHHDALCK